MPSNLHEEHKVFDDMIGESIRRRFANVLACAGASRPITN